MDRPAAPPRRRGRGWLGLIVVLLAPVAPAAAHTTATGLATLALDGPSLTYRLTLVAPELPAATAGLLAAGAGGDEASAERIATMLRQRVTVRADGAPCRPGRVRLQASSVGDGRVTLELALRCPHGPGRLTIRDDWSGVLGAHYRTILRADLPRGPREVAFLPESREAVLEVGGGGGSPRAGFFLLGVEHILTGYDHLLFLAALLLGGDTLGGMVKIVTAFTLAHSLTLALAVLGAATIPGRIIEPAIAASIAYVAAENLLGSGVRTRRWLVSFGFGLVHGFGFASALSPLALPPWSLAAALFGFNAGVEAGQGSVVLLAVPVLAWCRGRPWQPRLVRAVSVALVLVGLLWFVQRILQA